MALSSFGKVFGTRAQAARRHQPSAHAKFRPVLERLEDRIVLAVIHLSPGSPTAITDAVAAAMPGDRIEVAAGDYRGEGVILVNKKLDIEGAQEDHDPTKPGRTPAGPAESTVAGFDLQADKIEIEGFTINNSNGGDHFGDGITTSPGHSGYEIEDNIFSGNFRAGINLRSSGTFRTDIEHNWWDNFGTDLERAIAESFPSAASPLIANPPPPPLDQWDIRDLGFDFGPLSNVDIEKNKFSEPSRFGAAVDLEGTSASHLSRIQIEENHFEHSNGIILWNAVDSEISGNKMTDYTGPAGSSGGLGISLKFYLNNVEVNDNDLYAGSQSGDGVRIESATGAASSEPNVEVEDNTISGGTDNGAVTHGADGIDVIDTAPGFVVDIDDNDISHMGHDGIRLRGDLTGVSGALVHDNNVGFCQANGIDVQKSNGNFIRENNCHDNVGNGIFIDASNNNLVKRNDTRRNAVGIYVNSLSSGNTFERNKSFDNTVLDYRDSSNGGGTALTANTWTKNKGNTANPSGLIN